MGKALEKWEARNIGATTLQNKRVISWLQSSSAGERALSHDVKAAEFVDKSLIDSGHISRMKNKATSLLMASRKMPGELATSLHAGLCSLKTADIDIMLLSAVSDRCTGDDIMLFSS
jgi:hypothetical protein